MYTLKYILNASFTLRCFYLSHRHRQYINEQLLTARVIARNRRELSINVFCLTCNSCAAELRRRVVNDVVKLLYYDVCIYMYICVYIYI